MEDNGLYTVIAIDPGGTTGWCVMSTFPVVMGPPPFDRWLRERGATLPSTEADRLAWKQELANAAGFKLLENIAHFEVGQFSGDEDDQADAICELISAWPVESVILLERFKLRTYRMDDALLSPVRMNAIIQNRIRRLDIPGRNPRSVKRRPVYQDPPMALNSVTDDRLRSWWGGRLFNATRGLPHGRDATRHALTYLRREREARSRGKSLEVWPGVIRY
jgi:hypothetical protein